MAQTIEKNNSRRLISVMGLFLFSILGGLIVGLTTGVIGSFLYLVFLFPVFMGLAGGYMVNENLKYTKVRNQTFVLLSSILTVIVLYGSFHYMRYVGLQARTTFQLFGDFSDKNLEAGKLIVGFAIKEETGRSGFIGYMLLKAKEGISIGKIYSSNKLNLGSILTWVYWALEIGIIGFITITSGKQILKKPFCEFCNAWYPEKKHLGGVSVGKEKEILNLVGQKGFAAVGAILEEDAEVPSVELYLQSCNTCDKSHSFLKITRIDFINGKVTDRDLHEATLLPQEKRSLLDEIKYLQINT